LHGSSERPNAHWKVVEHMSMRWFNTGIKTELAGENNQLKDFIKPLRRLPADPVDNITRNKLLSFHKSSTKVKIA